MSITLAAISGIAGGLLPFIPEVFKFFNGKADRAHELAMTKLRTEAAGKEHLWRMEEVNGIADIEESKVLHRPQPAFGIQLLDKAASMSPWTWIILAPALLAYIAVDIFTTLVRPIITYALVGTYLATKWARVMLEKQATGEHFDVASAILNAWTPDDMVLLFTVVGFWFGQRVLHRAKSGKWA